MVLFWIDHSWRSRNEPSRPWKKQNRMLHVNRQSHLRKFEQSQRANTNLDTTTEPYMALKLLVSVYKIKEVSFNFPACLSGKKIGKVTEWNISKSLFVHKMLPRHKNMKDSITGLLVPVNFCKARRLQQKAMFVPLVSVNLLGDWATRFLCHGCVCLREWLWRVGKICLAQMTPQVNGAH